jgi:hypothetical protein
VPRKATLLRPENTRCNHLVRINADLGLLSAAQALTHQRPAGRGVRQAQHSHNSNEIAETQDPMDNVVRQVVVPTTKSRNFLA